jgi:hypothetical protein
MNTRRSLTAAAALLLVGGMAWWTMSGLDVGPDVPANAPRAPLADAEAPLPDAPPPSPTGAPLRLPSATPRGAPPPDALSRADQIDAQAQAPDPADEAHFQAVADAAMSSKLTAIAAQFASATRRLQGAERDDVKRVLDDAYGEMRDVAEQLKQRELDIGTAFGEVERIRDRAGHELDGTLPADRAAEVKAAAGVRSPDEAASAVDWGIPVDEATTDEVFRER